MRNSTHGPRDPSGRWVINLSVRVCLFCLHFCGQGFRLINSTSYWPICDVRAPSSENIFEKILKLFLAREKI